MALKILRAIKAEKAVSVKNLIHSRVAGYEKPRSHSTLHASDLMKDKEFCPREHAFLHLGAAKKKAEFISTALRITFDLGRFYETQIRDVYLRDIVVGYWACGICGHQHHTFGKEPKIKCSKCGWGHQWQYQEPRFISPSTGISGGIDLLIDVGEPKLRLIEVKSMDKDEFKKLAAPLAEHKFRTALYLRLADEDSGPESQRVNTKVAHIIYVSKSFGFKDTDLKADGIKDAAFSPFKEFEIVRDDAMSEVSYAKAKAFKAWQDNEKGGLPCGVCPNGLSKRAQGCTAVTACWSGSYPATISWYENGVIRHPGKKAAE